MVLERSRDHINPVVPTRLSLVILMVVRNVMPRPVDNQGESGPQWQRLSTGLPHVSVTGLEARRTPYVHNRPPLAT